MTWTMVYAMIHAVDPFAVMSMDGTNFVVHSERANVTQYIWCPDINEARIAALVSDLKTKIS